MRRRVLEIALISLFWTSGAVAAEPSLSFVRQIGGEHTIALDEVIGDLVVVDGRVEIAGVVRGHIYAIDSEVAVRSTGVVLSPVTVARGALHLQQGAVLPEAIDLLDAELFGPGGEAAPGAKPLILGNTEVRAHPLSKAQLMLMRTTVPFDRFTPGPDFDVPTLRAWHPGLGMVLRKFAEDPDELVVGGITKLSFVSNKVSGAFQRGYKSERGSVLLTGVRLVDDQAAAALWSEVAAVAPRVRVSLSVKSELGPGAHWFFRHAGRQVMIWQSGRWFLAVETRLPPDQQASVYQQKQFNEQVLEALRRALDGLRSLPQGVAR